MAWDTLMHAISTDNDNRDSNYTKSGSSITVSYHLNNQTSRDRGGEERKDPGQGVSFPYASQSKIQFDCL